MTILPLQIAFGNPLAGAFQEQRPDVRSRFANLLVTEELCRLRSRQGASRSRLCELVRASLGSAELSTKQLQNLDVLSKQNSVTVCTGQQVGLLGGPMYTLYKIASTVAEADRVTASSGHQAVPMFWLEDNDHDALEASSASILSADGTIETISAWSVENPRIPVSSRRFEDSESALIHKLIHQLSGEHVESVRGRLGAPYQAGLSWSDAFLAVLHPYLSAWGVLVMRASLVIESGLHQPIVKAALSDSVDIEDALHQGAEAVTKLGFTTQAHSEGFPFFVTQTDGRQRLDASSVQQLLEQEPNSITAISPTVLTRPIIQDAILPNVCNVLGAAEIAYHAQLMEAYQAFGLTQPVPSLRCGATLVDAKTARNMEKQGKDASWYFRHWEEIELLLTKDLMQGLLPTVDKRSDSIDDLVAPYLKAAEDVDVTLVASAMSAATGIASLLSTLEGKIRTAIKRRDSVNVERARLIHAILFPTGKLQERVYPLLMWESRLGVDTLRIIAEQIAGFTPGTHSVATIQEHQSADRS